MNRSSYAANEFKKPAPKIKNENMSYNIFTRTKHPSSTNKDEPEIAFGIKAHNKGKETAVVIAFNSIDEVIDFRDKINMAIVNLKEWEFVNEPL